MMIVVMMTVMIIGFCYGYDDSDVNDDDDDNVMMMMVRMLTMTRTTRTASTNLIGIHDEYVEEYDALFVAAF